MIRKRTEKDRWILGSPADLTDSSLSSHWSVLSEGEEDLGGYTCGRDGNFNSFPLRWHTVLGMLLARLRVVVRGAENTLFPVITAKSAVVINEHASFPGEEARIHGRVIRRFPTTAFA